MFGFVSELVSSVVRALDLEETSVGKVLTATGSILGGMVTGDFLSVAKGAMKAADAVASPPATVEFFHASDSPQKAAAAAVGYAASPAAGAPPSRDAETLRRHHFDAELRQAVGVLRQYFDLVDTAAGIDGRDGLIGREDLLAVVQNKVLPYELRRACQLLLDSPVVFNLVENASGVGAADKRIRREDLDALARPTGYAPPAGSASAAGASASSSASTWEREYANAVKALIDHFELIDRGGFLGLKDGKLTLGEIEKALKQNPDLPPDLKRALEFLLRNPAALNRLDTAAGIGGVDGRISLKDLNVEWSRVQKDYQPQGAAAAGPHGASGSHSASGAHGTSGTCGASGSPGSHSAAGGSPGAAASTWDRDYANAVKALIDHFELIDRGDILGLKDGKLTRSEIEKALQENPDLPPDLKRALEFLLRNPGALNRLDTAAGIGGVDGRISLKDLNAEWSRVQKDYQAPAAPAESEGPDTWTFRFSYTGSSAKGPRSSRFDGMTPEQIVEAIMLEMLNSLDSQMIDLAKELESAQNAHSAAEKGSNQEKSSAADVNRLNLKLQQIMERRREMFDLLSNLSRLSHEMARAAIGNIGRA